METEAAQPEVQQKIDALGAAEIVIGIPTLNNAATIGNVVREVSQGLRQYFPAVRSVIINSDGGSSDGTPAIVMESAVEAFAVLQVAHELAPVQKLSTPTLGIPGKGSAIRNIFQLARKLGAKACAVIDSDLRSVTPEWIRYLVEPVLDQGYDFVAPQYLRHKFDGTITNSIVYPMSRTLYGKRIRQPIGGEFCFSPTMLDRYLAQNVWETDVARYGIDIWLTTEALCSGARLCQVFLGARVHDPRDPASDLSSTLAQILGAVFMEMDRNTAVWQKIRGSTPVRTLGGVSPVEAEPVKVDAEPVKVDAAKMMDAVRLGLKNLFEIWSLVLPPGSLLELRKYAQRPLAEFRMPDELWVRIVYDFAVAHHFRTISRDHLLRAFTPLYLGWVASFVMEMETADGIEVEARIEKLCVHYEAQKPYLISRWRWPDRF
jgi:glucosylglycerate synthase